MRELIELHGGRVEAKSDGPQAGSEFVLHLPAMDMVPDKELASPPSQLMVGLKMLLVEDSADAAEAMAVALETLGCHVVVAHNAPEALAAIATDCPDVGLLDIGLPGMTGYGLATRLRSEGFCSPSLKLIAMTGYAKDVDALAAAGFDGYLTKPVDFSQLRQTLADIVTARPEPWTDERAS